MSTFSLTDDHAPATKKIITLKSAASGDEWLVEVLQTEGGE
jgi:hypothetical protein